MEKKRLKVIRREQNMNAIINLTTEEEARIRSYTLKDLILDPKKKAEHDNFFKQNYEYIEKDDFAKKMYGKNNDKR